MRARPLAAVAAAISAGALAAAPAVEATAAEPILPLAHVTSGLVCSARTVIRGTAISTFTATVLDVVAPTGGEGARILVRVSGPAVDGTGVAEGFSGSPVYCPAPGGGDRVAGAISETLGDYGSHLALVTPIESILGVPVHPPAGAVRLSRVAAGARPLRSPLTFGGLAAPVRAALQAAARRARREVLAVPAHLGPDFPPQELVPGASLAVGYATGDVTLGSVGTVTYRDGARLWAFGHELDGAGRRSLALQDAYVYTVVANPVGLEGATSYKLAAPGHVLGTLTSDTPDGVAGIVGAAPRSIPLTVTARDLDRGRTQRVAAAVADETDVGSPLGVSTLSVAVPVAVAQAVTAGFDGAPARETARFCVRVSLREARRRLGFCTRVVLAGRTPDTGGTTLAAPLASLADAVPALIDASDAGPLHPTSFSVSADLRRGLALARMLSASAEPAMPGQTTTVRIRARVFGGGVREFAIRVRVPRGLRRGSVRMVLRGPGADTGDTDLAAPLSSALSGSEAGGVPVSRGLAELRRRIAAIGVPDGPRVSFAGVRHAVRATADPSARLSGTVALRLSLRG